MDGGVAAVVVDLGEPDDLVAAHDADRLRGEVEGRTLPVRDVVGLLDQHLADVVELLRADEPGHGGGVVHDDRSGRVPLGHGQGSCGHGILIPVHGSAARLVFTYASVCAE